MEKNKSNKKRNLPLTYVIGMPILFVIANFIASLHLEIGNSTLYFCVLIYPLTYLISGLIIRKTDYKDALRMMVVSLACATLALVLEWVVMDSMNALVAIYAFLSFLICQLLFIYLYDFLIKINKDSYMPVFILVVIIEAIDAAFFGILIENHYISITTLIRLIYAVAIPVILARKANKSIKENKE